MRTLTNTSHLCKGFAKVEYYQSLYKVNLLTKGLIYQQAGLSL